MNSSSNGDAVVKPPKRRGRWDITQDGDVTPAKKPAKAPTVTTTLSWDKEEAVSQSSFFFPPDIL